MRHSYLSIGNPDAILNVDDAEFEDQADEELTSQVIALSTEKSEIDYIRAHLGMIVENEINFLLKIFYSTVA